MKPEPSYAVAWKGRASAVLYGRHEMLGRQSWHGAAIVRSGALVDSGDEE